MSIQNEIYELSEEFPVLRKLLDEDNFEQLLNDVNLAASNIVTEPDQINSIMERASHCALALYGSAKERGLEWEADKISAFIQTEKAVWEYINSASPNKETVLYNITAIMLQRLIEELKPVLILSDISMRLKKISS